MFESPEQLSGQLYGLLKGHPTETADLRRLRSSLTTVEVSVHSLSFLFFSSISLTDLMRLLSRQHWPENWNRVALPLFHEQLGL